MLHAETNFCYGLIAASYSLSHNGLGLIYENICDCTFVHTRPSVQRWPHSDRCNAHQPLRSTEEKIQADQAWLPGQVLQAS
jgi:hypothetical protein